MHEKRPGGNQNLLTPLKMTCVVLLLVGFLAPGPILGARQNMTQDSSSPSSEAFPVRPDDPDDRVDDTTGLLTASSQAQLNADLARLRSRGVEPFVFLRQPGDALASSTGFAEELRTEWQVETYPGADDGLVVVVSISADNPAGSTVDISFGQDAPMRLGTSPEDLESWAQTYILPGIRSGDYRESLRDATRRLTGTLFEQAGVLTERQRNAIHSDILRLQRLGVPATVYMEPTVLLEGGPQERADAIRRDLQVDSSSDADDGVLYYFAVDVVNPENSAVAISAGSNAYPIRQLDATRMDALLKDYVAPELEQGNAYLSVAHAVRRTINYAEYSPPEPSPLSSAQQSLQLPLYVAAAILVQVTVFGFLLVPAVLERRITLRPSRHSLLVYGLVVGTIAVAIGTLGILDRNGIVTLCGLAMFVWAAGVVPFLAHRAKRTIGQCVNPQPDVSQAGAHDAAPAS